MDHTKIVKRNNNGYVVDFPSLRRIQRPSNVIDLTLFQLDTSLRYLEGNLRMSSLQVEGALDIIVILFLFTITVLGYYFIFPWMLFNF